jgi:hypothetical protein
MPAVRQRSPKVHGVLAVKPSRRAAIEVSKDSSRYGHDAKQHGKEKRERERGFTNSAPQGQLKVVQDCAAAYFQPSLRDWIVFFRPTQD